MSTVKVILGAIRCNAKVERWLLESYRGYAHGYIERPRFYTVAWRKPVLTYAITICIHLALMNSVNNHLTVQFLRGYVVWWEWHQYRSHHKNLYIWMGYPSGIMGRNFFLFSGGCVCG